MLTGRLVIDYQLKRKLEATTANGEVAADEKSRKFDWRAKKVFFFQIYDVQTTASHIIPLYISAVIPIMIIKKKMF